MLSRTFIIPMLARKLIAALLCIAVYPFIMLLIFRPDDADPNFFTYVMAEIDGVFGLLILHAALLLLLGLPISIGIEFVTTLIYRQ